jgi:hypothetical protein
VCLLPAFSFPFLAGYNTFIVIYCNILIRSNKYVSAISLSIGLNKKTCYFKKINHAARTFSGRLYVDET